MPKQSDAERLKSMIRGRWRSKYFYANVDGYKPMLIHVEHGDLAALKRILKLVQAWEGKAK